MLPVTIIKTIIIKTGMTHTWFQEIPVYEYNVASS